MPWVSLNVTKCHENWAKRESKFWDLIRLSFYFTLRTCHSIALLKGSQTRMFQKIRMRSKSRFSRKMSRNVTKSQISTLGTFGPARTSPGRHDTYVRATRFTCLRKTYMAVTWHKFLRKQFTGNVFRSISILVGWDGQKSWARWPKPHIIWLPDIFRHLIRPKLKLT